MKIQIVEHRNTVTCPHIVFYNMNTGNVTTS
ncbi:hypothetical protein DJ56_4144 [Yersinia pestis]|nr:hypothetical protein DJ56_4144 [Yersinia pestis]